MKIILATGIYPPQIGGPATYCKHLAEELTADGHDVSVVTFGEQQEMQDTTYNVYYVSRRIPILRWWWYSQKLQDIGKDADVVYAFSSISCGIPLIISGIKKPKRILRLGGDFLWERYTDFGGEKSLRDFYASSYIFGKTMMQWIFNQFDHIVFSTEFQQKIYEESYHKLPKHSIIENALPMQNIQHDMQDTHRPHTPFRLLFMGRTVKFKNIISLIDAVAQMQHSILTIVGSGPLDDVLRKKVERLGLHQRIRFVAPVYGQEKLDIFAMHDLLILPSITDISPNTALEASMAGLPVLLTKETGLSKIFFKRIHRANLLSPADIVSAVSAIQSDYIHKKVMEREALPERSWNTVSREHISLFDRL